MSLNLLKSLVFTGSVALIALASTGLAQAPTPRVAFSGSISVPVDLKSLHPDVGKVILHCDMTQTGPGGTRTNINWPAPASAATGGGAAAAASYQAIQATVSGGAVQTTLVSHFSAVRTGTFAPGEAWAYQCQIVFVGRAGSTSGEVEVTPGVGPNFQGMAQLTSGTTLVQGTFTLQ